MINDTATPYKYDDDRLQELILVSAQLMSNMLVFNNTYTIDVSQALLSPDPTDRDANTREDSFINLTCLKAACIIDNGEARAAAGSALTIRDSRRLIATEGTAKAKLEILKNGWCAAFEEAQFDFRAGNTGSAGQIILSPFRTGYSSYPFVSNYLPLDGRYR